VRPCRSRARRGCPFGCTGARRGRADDLARKVHEGWRAWCNPLNGHKIRLRTQNQAVSGHHAPRHPRYAAPADPLSARRQADHRPLRRRVGHSRRMPACWRCVRSRSASAWRGGFPTRWRAIRFRNSTSPRPGSWNAARSPCRQPSSHRHASSRWAGAATGRRSRTWPAACRPPTASGSRRRSPSRGRRARW
jgi:hypothetical protein